MTRMIFKILSISNISLENRGKRYPVPQLPEEFMTWQEWMQSEVKRIRFALKIMNATNNEKLVPISSPDENKKDLMCLD